MTEPDFHYTWPTWLRAHPLLGECTPYNRRGGFRAAVEVVIFPKEKSTGYTVMTSADFLERGADLDAAAAAIRFNTDTIVEVDAVDQRHADPFSVIWVPDRVPGDPQAVGRVHLVGPSWITAIMRDMVEKSATGQVSVDSVLAGAERLNGSAPPSAPRPSLTDTGLVKSVSVPPGRLRVVSRLDDELLRRRSTLMHELVIATTVPSAVGDAADLECEIAVFPKGWVSLRSPSTRSSQDVVRLPVPGEWGRPQEGRTGLGSRYVFESIVSRKSVRLVSNPPASRRPASGRRSAEVRVRVLQGDVELCRLHHPFWIEPRAQASPSAPHSSAFAEELQRVLALLDDDDVARATGVRVATVQAWLKDAREPSGNEAERVNELVSIVDRLAVVMDPDFIALWLRKPLRVLDDDKPLDVLANGDYKAVSRVVAALESPVAS
ncbi:MAG: hypothetical protein M3203_11315 [Actinomycetota bacterium]|nr:hypothetical protein [Actinomycetota bacterium]